jgi:hypothetical protein
MEADLKLSESVRMHGCPPCEGAVIALFSHFVLYVRSYIHCFTCIATSELGVIRTPESIFELHPEMSWTGADKTWTFTS